MLVISFVLVATVSPPARAADKKAPAGEADAKPSEGSNIDQLARDGYWGKEDTWATHAKLLNKPAPKLDITNWINGQPTGLRGKITVIDYWATWCGPCIRSIPHNNEVAKHYADKGVVVIGACGGGQEERMAAVAKEHGIEYPTGKVSEASTKAWGVHWWPTYAIVDRKGNLRAVGIQPAYVEKIVDALLEEQPADKASSDDRTSKERTPRTWEGATRRN